MVLKPAYPTGASHPIFGEALGPAARDELKARVRAAPALWVAQARVPLSTTPVIDGAELQSRHLVVRSFLVARQSGGGAGSAGGERQFGNPPGDFDVMPGALSLVGSPTEREISMQRGAGSADTWVVSGGPVNTFSLLPRASHPFELSRGGGDLPSRVADNLFWLGPLLRARRRDRAPGAHGERASGRTARRSIARAKVSSARCWRRCASRRAPPPPARSPRPIRCSCGRSSASCWRRCSPPITPARCARRSSRRTGWGAWCATGSRPTPGAS